MAQGRMLKASIRTSKSVNALSDFNFRVWAYLITYVDDYGRGSADPELLKGFVFPRRKGITEGQIKKAITDLANAGMIVLYESDGESFLYFPNWSKHQRIQTKKSMFPEPENCSTVTHRDSPPEIEVEVEVEDEVEYEVEIEKEKTKKKENLVEFSEVGHRGSKTVTDCFAEFSGEDRDLLSALRDFETMRNKIKKPLTDSSKQRLLHKLEEFPREQWIQILAHSVDHCWQDVYPLKEQKETPVPVQPQKTNRTYTPVTIAPNPDHVRSIVDMI